MGTVARRKIPKSSNNSPKLLSNDSPNPSWQFNDLPKAAQSSAQMGDPLIIINIYKFKMNHMIYKLKKAQKVQNIRLNGHSHSKNKCHKLKPVRSSLLLDCQQILDEQF
jgi:hypothetical protein